jgi:hypothetical protein
MHNKFNKHKRKQDFFQVRLARERETFYKTCMNSCDNNKLKDVEKRMEEIKKTMRRKEIRRASECAKITNDLHSNITSNLNNNNKEKNEVNFV